MTTKQRPSLALVGVVTVILLAVLFGVVACLADQETGGGQVPDQAPGIDVDVDVHRGNGTGKKDVKSREPRVVPQPVRSVAAPKVATTRKAAR